MKKLIFTAIIMFTSMPAFADFDWQAQERQYNDQANQYQQTMEMQRQSRALERQAQAMDRQADKPQAHSPFSL